jgi:glycosyltransferase involved in cell wall biosynthesis
MNMETYHFGFVIEQALGHVTHAKNLQKIIPRDPSIVTWWGLPAWDTAGWTAQIPFYRSNWALRASLRTRQELSSIQSRLTQCYPGRKAPDALFFHTEITAVLSLDWLARIPSIVSLDATPLQYDRLGAFYEHNPRSAWLEKSKWYLYRETFRRAQRLVTWSHWAMQGLVDEYQVPKEKIAVIPPGVNTRLWERPWPRRLHQGPVKILFVGGNLARKGGRLLLNVFRRLRSEFPKALELHLVTHDSIPKEEGVFVYHNLQPNSSELIGLYHKSDLFCLPTYGDCLPMVLSEAGAAGLPVVSTRIAGIPEIVIDGETGFLVTPGSEDELYQALLTLIQNPELRLRQGNAAIQHVRQYFDAEINAFHLLDQMKALVTGEVPIIIQQANERRIHESSAHDRFQHHSSQSTG